MIRFKSKISIFFIILSALLLLISLLVNKIMFLSYFAMIPFLYLIVKNDSIVNLLKISILFCLLFYLPGNILLVDNSLISSIITALYLIPFVFIFCFILNIMTRKAGKSFLLWGAPVIWCGLEILRAEIIPFKLPFLLIAHTQSANLWLLQFADSFGTYGISGIIIFINAAALFVILSRSFIKNCMVLATLVFLFVYTWGYSSYKISKFSKEVAKPLSIAGIHLNSSQPIEKLEDNTIRTFSVLDLKNLNLVVWPQDAFLDQNANEISKKIENICIDNYTYLAYSYITQDSFSQTHHNIIYSSSGIQILDASSEYFLGFLTKSNNDVVSSAYLGKCVCIDPPTAISTNTLRNLNFEYLVMPFGFSNDSFLNRLRGKYLSNVQVFRAIELRTYIFIVGHNSPSAIISPTGRFARYIEPGKAKIFGADISLNSRATKYSLNSDNIFNITLLDTFILLILSIYFIAREN